MAWRGGGRSRSIGLALAPSNVVIVTVSAVMKKESTMATMRTTERPLYHTYLVVLLLVGHVMGSWAFLVHKPQTKTCSRLVLAAKTNNEEKEMDPLTKASWYGVELFGKVFGDKNKVASTETVNLDAPPTSMKETFERIQLDNDRSYFLSGNVDKLIYDEDCVFADPFVSFSGRDRFVDNLQNLGSFITKYSAKMLDYTQEEDTVKTRVMVKLELNLPWKPILAWPWGVKYDIDPETFLVTNHVESWDIEPLEVSCLAALESDL